MATSEKSCPCGGGAYDACCGPFHSGTAHAPTAEKLMRSRYSAYALQEIDYLEETQAPEANETFDKDDAAAWSRNAEWIGLHILKTERGGETDDAGIVEFIARYRQENNELAHHERSTFVRRDDRWYYKDGDVLADPVKRDKPKVGRNDPCPCGSGKKYKKCCGGRA